MTNNDLSYGFRVCYVLTYFVFILVCFIEFYTTILMKYSPKWRQIIIIIIQHIYYRNIMH